MAYQYLFDPVAAEEYENSFKWYEKKSVVAADGFIVAVQDAITAVCANPDRYRITHKNLREITLKRFPFNLIYYIDENRRLIVVTSLYHHKRNPGGKYIKEKHK